MIYGKYNGYTHRFPDLAPVDTYENKESVRRWMATQYPEVQDADIVVQKQNGEVTFNFVARAGTKA